MSAYARWIDISGLDSGLGSALEYAVYGPDNMTVLVSRRNTGVVESQGVNASAYGASVAWDTSWGGVIRWTTGAGTVLQGTETFQASVLEEALSPLPAVPSAIASVKDALNWLFVLARNKRVQTATVETVYQDDGATPLATSSKADSGTVFTRSKYS